MLCTGAHLELLFALCPPCEERVNGYPPINISCICASPQVVALPRGDDSAAAPPGLMPPLYPGVPLQSSFSGLQVEKEEKEVEAQPIRTLRAEVSLKYS